MPNSGWPWHLTDYEIQYIQVFNVRPVRGEWSGTVAQENSLDLEADGVRALKASKSSKKPLPLAHVPRRLRRWWIVIPASIFLAALGGGYFAFQNFSNVHQIEKMIVSANEEWK